MQHPDDPRRGTAPPNRDTKRSRQGDRRICSFFAQGHCRKGDQCDYLHVRGNAGGEQQERGAGQRPGTTDARADRCHAGSAQRSAFGAVKGLSRQQKLRNDADIKDFLGATLASLSDPVVSEQALQLLCGARIGSGAGGAADEKSNAPAHVELLLKDMSERHKVGKITDKVFRERVVPLLRLLSDEAVVDSLRSHWTSPLLHSVLHKLDWSALAAVYEQLSRGELSADFGGASAEASTNQQQQLLHWAPSSALDVLEPPARLLNALLERFQLPADRQPLLAHEPSPSTPQQQEQQREGTAAAGASSGGGSSSGSSGAAGAAVRAAGPAAKRLLDVLQALHGTLLAMPAGGAGYEQACRRRRLLEVLRSVERQLQHGRDRELVLDEAEAAQRRRAEAAREAAERGDRAAAVRLQNPDHLPGELRLSGATRHDNDAADYRAIQVVPTCAELLCAEEPYLPSNRPGSMPHLQDDPQRARLEINFRLLRHDAIAPLATALTAFLRVGGLAVLPPPLPPAEDGRGPAARYQQQPRGGGSDRLRLEGGTQLFVYWDVRFEGLELTKHDGAVLKVSLRQPQQALARAPGGHQLEEYWKRSKRLAHGTLLAFWWEPAASAAGAAGGAGAAAAAASRAAAAAGRVGAGGGASGAGGRPMPQPRLVVGVVAQREPKDLAQQRAHLGIRLVSRADYEALLGAWLDAAAGCGGEVVVVQEHNSFFAYEPVLRALQEMTSIPLAQHLVPGFALPPPAPDTSTASTARRTGAQRQPPAPAPALLCPAYLADSPVCDLRHIVDEQRVMALPQEEQVRVLRALSCADLSAAGDGGGGGFPLAELLAATTLDRAQAEALRAVLSREVAVVQGPPGTGKTYLGVVLTKALLCNTRNSAAEGNEDAEERAQGRLGGRRAPREPVAGAAAPLPKWIAARVGPEAAAPPPPLVGGTGPPPPRPDIGPVLVVCFTNHALDSFLEGLLDGGVTRQIVRVGSNSKNERLQEFNLRNLQDRAYGLQPLYKRIEALAAQAAALSDTLQALTGGGAWTGGRPLNWRELEPLMRERHPALHGSFRRGRRPWNRRPEELAQQLLAGGADSIVAAEGEALQQLQQQQQDGDGWEVVGARGRRGGKRQQRAPGDGYADLVSDDWLRGAPDKDWRVGRVMLEAERAAAAAAAVQRDQGGMIASDDEGEGEGGPADGMDWDGLGAGGGAAGGPAGGAGPGWWGAVTTARAAGAGPLMGLFGGALAGGGGPAAAAVGGMMPPPPPPPHRQRANAPAAAAAAGAAAPAVAAGRAPAAAAAAAAAQAADGADAADLTPAQMAARAAMARMRQQAAEMEAAMAAAARDREQQQDAPQQEEQPQPQQQQGGAAHEGAAAAPQQQQEGRQRRRRMASGRSAASEAAEEAGPPAPPAPAPPPAEVLAMCARSRPTAELLAADDVWSMSRPERKRLYAELQRLRYLRLLQEVQEVQQEFEAAEALIKETQNAAKLSALRSARVVGMTTSGVARMQELVAAMKPRVLLVEEAAEVYEAHVLVCLSRSVEHLVLIGDHEQLRPKPNEFCLQVESGRGLDLDLSLFERLVRQASFTVASLQEQRRMRPQISKLIRGTIYPHLRDHPRVAAHPHLRGLAHDVFFLDHDHPEGGGGGGGAGGAPAGEDRSKYNQWEAAYCVQLARYLLMQGYDPGSIVILVTYTGQLHRVRDEMARANLRLVVSERDREQLDKAGLAEEDDANDGASENGGAALEAATAAAPAAGGGGSVRVLSGDEDAAAMYRGGSGSGSGRTDFGSAWRAKTAALGQGGGAAAAAAGERLPDGCRVVTMREGIRCATVDNYQGEEADVILLSTVRNAKDGRIGFLRLRNRVNVMLSRARHGMVVLGNQASLRAGAEKYRVPMWRQVLDMLQQDGCVGPCLKAKCVNHGEVTEIWDVGDFGRLVGDGGCRRPCGVAMPCGHTCPRSCHADDREHRYVTCTKPCMRLHKTCGHACERTCGEACGRCARRITEPYQLECGHAGPQGVPCWKRYATGTEAIRCCEPVDVALPACGHTLTVPCCEADGVRTGGRPCSQMVDVVMPACGHTLCVPCGDRAALLADPTRCTAVCGARLACLHECGGTCGGCMRRVLRERFDELVTQGFIVSQGSALHDAWGRANRGGPDAGDAKAAAWLRFLSAEGPGAVFHGRFLTWIKDRLAAGGSDDAASPYAACHAACSKPCGKALVCGHDCAARCHRGSPCAPCAKPCWISCAHHLRCSRKCGEPCVSCAEPCVWRCEHRGACTAPCGAPCNRLPCDQRCSLKLACGHRCPGLCGEQCPPRQFCVDPACLAKADSKIKDQQVDMVMLRSLGELAPADVDDDPLVVLPCRHAFLVSSLDGHLDMGRFYERDAQGQWLRPLPLGAEAGGKSPVVGCPQCRQPIAGVRRYGRAVNKSALDLTHRKHMYRWEVKLGEALTQLQHLRRHVGEPQKEAAAAAAGGRGRGGPPTPPPPPQQQPQQSRLQAELAYAEARVMDQLVRYGQRQQMALDAGAVLAPMHMVLAHARRTLQLFQDVCDAYLSPPLRLVYEAALAQLQRYEQEEAAAPAIAAAGAAAVAGAATSASGPAEMSEDEAAARARRAARLQLARQDLNSLRPDTTQLCKAWCGILGCGAVYVAAGAAGAARVRSLLGGDGQRALLALPKRIQGVLRSQLWSQLQYLLLDSLLACDAFLYERAPVWRQQAAANRYYNSAFALSEAAMRMGLAQLQLVDEAAALPRSGAAAVMLRGANLSFPLLGDMREAVIQQLRAEGNAAQALYRGDSGFAGAGHGNVHIEAVEALMLQLDRLEEQVTLQDVMAALRAVAAQEYGGAADAMGWLTSHLYQCPNGHLYTIGECGGAMQQSVCPECGAVIGGGSHRLAGGNAPASATLQQLQQLAGRG